MDAAAAAGVADARVIDGAASSEYGDSEMADVGRMLAARIAKDRKRPTGVVAVNDMLAFGLLAGFRDAGLAVPDDVSVIGMDGLFLSSFTIPGLTTIACRCRRWRARSSSAWSGAWPTRTSCPTSSCSRPNSWRASRSPVRRRRCVAKARR